MSVDMKQTLLRLQNLIQDENPTDEFLGSTLECCNSIRFLFSDPERLLQSMMFLTRTAMTLFTLLTILPILAKSLCEKKWCPYGNDVLSDPGLPEKFTSDSFLYLYIRAYQESIESVLKHFWLCKPNSYHLLLRDLLDIHYYLKNFEKSQAKVMNDSDGAKNSRICFPYFCSVVTEISDNISRSSVEGIPWVLCSIVQVALLEMITLDLYVAVLEHSNGVSSVFIHRIVDSTLGCLETYHSTIHLTTGEIPPSLVSLFGADNYNLIEGAEFKNPGKFSLYPRSRSNYPLSRIFRRITPYIDTSVVLTSIEKLLRCEWHSSGTLKVLSMLIDTIPPIITPIRMVCTEYLQRRGLLTIEFLGILHGIEINEGYLGANDTIITENLISVALFKTLIHSDSSEPKKPESDEKCRHVLCILKKIYGITDYDSKSNEGPKTSDDEFTKSVETIANNTNDSYHDTEDDVEDMMPSIEDICQGIDMESLADIETESLEELAAQCSVSDRVGCSPENLDMVPHETAIQGDHLYVGRVSPHLVKPGAHSYHLHYTRILEKANDIVRHLGFANDLYSELLISSNISDYQRPCRVTPRSLPGELLENISNQKTHKVDISSMLLDILIDEASEIQLENPIDSLSRLISIKKALVAILPIYFFVKSLKYQENKSNIVYMHKTSWSAEFIDLSGEIQVHSYRIVEPLISFPSFLLQGTRITNECNTIYYLAQFAVDFILRGGLEMLFTNDREAEHPLERLMRLLSGIHDSLSPPSKTTFSEGVLCSKTESVPFFFSDFIRVLIMMHLPPTGESSTTSRKGNVFPRCLKGTKLLFLFVSFVFALKTYHLNVHCTSAANQDVPFINLANNSCNEVSRRGENLYKFDTATFLFIIAYYRSLPLNSLLDCANDFEHTTKYNTDDSHVDLIDPGYSSSPRSLNTNFRELMTSENMTGLKEAIIQLLICSDVITSQRLMNLSRTVEEVSRRRNDTGNESILIDSTRMFDLMDSTCGEALCRVFRSQLINHCERRLNGVLGSQEENSVGDLLGTTINTKGWYMHILRLLRLREHLFSSRYNNAPNNSVNFLLQYLPSLIVESLRITRDNPDFRDTAQIFIEGLVHHLVSEKAILMNLIIAHASEIISTIVLNISEEYVHGLNGVEINSLNAKHPALVKEASSLIHEFLSLVSLYKEREKTTTGATKRLVHEGPGGKRVKRRKRNAPTEVDTTIYSDEDVDSRKPTLSLLNDQFLHILSNISGYSIPDQPQYSSITMFISMSILIEVVGYHYQEVLVSNLTKVIEIVHSLCINNYSDVVWNEYSYPWKSLVVTHVGRPLELQKFVPIMIYDIITYSVESPVTRDITVLISDIFRGDDIKGGEFQNIGFGSLLSLHMDSFLEALDRNADGKDPFHNARYMVGSVIDGSANSGANGNMMSVVNRLHEAISYVNRQLSLQYHSDENGDITDIPTKNQKMEEKPEAHSTKRHLKASGITCITESALCWVLAEIIRYNIEHFARLSGSTDVRDLRNILYLKLNGNIIESTVPNFRDNAVYLLVVLGSESAADTPLKTLHNGELDYSTIPLNAEKWILSLRMTGEASPTTRYAEYNFRPEVERMSNDFSPQTLLLVSSWFPEYPGVPHLVMSIAGNILSRFIIPAIADGDSVSAFCAQEILKALGGSSFLEYAESHLLLSTDELISIIPYLSTDFAISRSCDSPKSTDLKDCNEFITWICAHLGISTIANAIHNNPIRQSQLSRSVSDTCTRHHFCFLLQACSGALEVFPDLCHFLLVHCVAFLLHSVNTRVDTVRLMAKRLLDMMRSSSSATGEIKSVVGVYLFLLKWRYNISRNSHIVDRKQQERFKSKVQIFFDSKTYLGPGQIETPESSNLDPILLFIGKFCTRKSLYNEALLFLEMFLQETRFLLPGGSHEPLVSDLLLIHGNHIIHSNSVHKSASTRTPSSVVSNTNSQSKPNCASEFTIPGKEQSEYYLGEVIDTMKICYRELSHTKNNNSIQDLLQSLVHMYPRYIIGNHLSVENSAGFDSPRIEIREDKLAHIAAMSEWGDLIAVKLADNTSTSINTETSETIQINDFDFQNIDIYVEHVVDSCLDASIRLILPITNASTFVKPSSDDKMNSRKLDSIHSDSLHNLSTPFSSHINSISVIDTQLKNNRASINRMKPATFPLLWRFFIRNLNLSRFYSAPVIVGLASRLFYAAWFFDYMREFVVASDAIDTGGIGTKDMAENFPSWRNSFSKKLRILVHRLNSEWSSKGDHGINLLEVCVMIRLMLIITKSRKQTIFLDQTFPEFSDMELVISQILLKYFNYILAERDLNRCFKYLRKIDTYGRVHFLDEKNKNLFSSFLAETVIFRSKVLDLANKDEDSVNRLREAQTLLRSNALPNTPTETSTSLQTSVGLPTNDSSTMSERILFYSKWKIGTVLLQKECDLKLKTVNDAIFAYNELLRESNTSEIILLDPQLVSSTELAFAKYLDGIQEEIEQHIGRTTVECSPDSSHIRSARMGVNQGMMTEIVIRYINCIVASPSSKDASFCMNRIMRILWDMTTGAFVNLIPLNLLSEMQKCIGHAMTDITYIDEKTSSTKATSSRKSALTFRVNSIPPNYISHIHPMISILLKSLFERWLIPVPSDVQEKITTYPSFLSDCLKKTTDSILSDNKWRSELVITLLRRKSTCIPQSVWFTCLAQILPRMAPPEDFTTVRQLTRLMSESPLKFQAVKSPEHIDSALNPPSVSTLQPIAPLFALHSCMKTMNDLTVDFLGDIIRSIYVAYPMETCWHIVPSLVEGPPSEQSQIITSKVLPKLDGKSSKVEVGVDLVQQSYEAMDLPGVEVPDLSYCEEMKPLIISLRSLAEVSNCSSGKNSLSNFKDVYDVLGRSVRHNGHRTELTEKDSSPAAENHTCDIKRIIVPLVSSIGSGSKLSSMGQNIYIEGWDPDVVIMGSKAKPKKIGMIGSDGKLYSFLCKREKTGDMRKDSRMMDLFHIINTYISAERATPRNAENRSLLRSIHVQLYSVVCLSKDSGLIEWIPNLITLRSCITSSFELVHDACDRKSNRVSADPFQILLTEKVRDEIGCPKNGERNFLSLSRKFRPTIQYWIHNKSKDPRHWAEMTENFAGSQALWNSLGYILGLGDRHCENILLNEDTASISHVDFDCIFEAGALLHVPEIVPFRLTSNCISAMGIRGVEGTYRKVAEVVTQIFRENRNEIVSTLLSFVADPIIQWTISAKTNTKLIREAWKGGCDREKKTDSAIKQSTKKYNEMMRATDKAKETVRRIDAKLKGAVYQYKLAEKGLIFEEESNEHLPLELRHLSPPMSVAGQVDQLIRMATDPENLRRMYIGWMPLL